MKAISKLEMSPDEWLSLRKRSVGASEVAVLLGLNPYKTTFQLWEEKIMEGPLEQVENEAIHFGNKLEQTVAEEYAERSGRKVIRDNKIRIHPDVNFFTCNLDRVILPTNGEGRGVLECKTASSFTAQQWESEVPPMYYAQVQAQLSVTGYKWGALALLVDGRKFKSFDIERDEALIQSLVTIVNSFWNDYVIPKLPPPMVISDYARVQSEEGSVIEAGDEVYAAYQQLLRVNSDIAELEGNKEQLENTIKLAMGTSETLAREGIALATWKTSKASTTFDAKKFKTENPEMAAKYEVIKPGSRRFLTKGGK